MSLHALALVPAKAEQFPTAQSAGLAARPGGQSLTGMRRHGSARQIDGNSSNLAV
jgi:hypothetical protein